MTKRKNQSSSPESGNARLRWSDRLSPYMQPNSLKSCWQIVNTLIPFALLWTLMAYCASWSYPLTLLLAVPTAGFLVRLFIIQHDCGHHSFFRSRQTNDLVGGICGLLTLTPYYLWRRSHSRHHASSGDLSHRGHGDVWVMTADEYRTCTVCRRLQYRLYRSPVVMFLIGPTLLFIVQQRTTLGIPRNWPRERKSVHLTNLGIAVALGVAWRTIGIGTAVAVHLPVMMLAASIGSWLFFVQHQFEEGYWQQHQDWSFAKAAFDGSSYYRLPRVLQWFTGNIGFHHIHHFESRIPNYNLQACYADLPEMREAVTFGLWQSRKCTRMKLWDENLQRMITFQEALPPFTA
jgi:omega-6 fatty acid desaturase (delta-12 desaturase)